MTLSTVSTFINLLTCLLIGITTCNGTNPTADEVVTCFDHIQSAFNIQNDGTFSMELADKLSLSLDKSLFDTLCNEVDWIASSVQSLFNSDHIRRRLSNIDPPECINDYSHIFCEPTTPIYPEGPEYDIILTNLETGFDGDTLLINGDKTMYTLANNVAKLILLSDIQNSVSLSVDVSCFSATSTITDVDFDGTTCQATAEATADAGCAVSIEIITTLGNAIDFLLKQVNFQDKVLMSTQIQTLFEDRQRIISNQKQILYKLDILYKLIKVKYRASMPYSDVDADAYAQNEALLFDTDNDNDNNHNKSYNTYNNELIIFLLVIINVNILYLVFNKRKNSITKN